MDKEILEYIRNSKPSKTLKEALNEIPEEISKSLTNLRNR